MMTTKPVNTVIGVVLTIALAGCTRLTTDRYEATALTRYTWQVSYSADPTHTRGQRFEAFSSTTLLNQNGQNPVDAVTGPDDRGLWWAALPPRPTMESIERRQQPLEQPDTPQLIKQVDYRLSFQRKGAMMTLPTNYDVYREAVKAKRIGASLALTLGLGDRTVEKAEHR
ncbi:MAG: hypothetical protein KME45_05355 [Stenomitos rutilans HA7619-LM2]|nr:hypothetical protein [Stenomitos rutilans HA7619-LM2]